MQEKLTEKMLVLQRKLFAFELFFLFAFDTSKVITHAWFSMKN